MGESLLKAIFIGVVIILLGIFFGDHIKDAMNLPEAIPSVQTNTEEVCPQSLNFISGEDIEDFSLTIKNAGDDGTLYVLLQNCPRAGLCIVTLCKRLWPETGP